MAYVSEHVGADRAVHDADSHIFEPPGYAEAYADPKARALLADVRTLAYPKAVYERALEKQRSPERVEREREEIMLHKNLDALGAFEADDRPRALDFMGFASQLVFTTSYLGALRMLDRAAEPEAAYGLATGHNRGMVDFCSRDPRLLPVGYVPLCDLERAATATREAIDLGCAALMVASEPPRHHSPSHVGLDPVWAQAQEAGVPIVFHVGGEKPMDPVYKENGLPPVPDFHGGDANFTSVSYLAIPYSPMQTLGTLIIDGVLERFPALKIGVIELGASWVPGWMRSMDSAADAFRKNETRLQSASLKPSEYVRRQVRVTPYPHEDAGWIIRNTGPEVALFSSDYPHVEGGRNPIKRFTNSLAECSDAEREAFYRTNFEDLMGASLERTGVLAGL